MSPEPSPRYRVPDNVAWVDGADYGFDDELYLTIVPAGDTVLLKDTARLIWLTAIVEEGHVVDSEDPVSQRADDVVVSFLDQLVSHRLMRRWT